MLVHLSLGKFSIVIFQCGIYAEILFEDCVLGLKVLDTTHPDIRLRKAALGVYLVSAEMFHEVYIQYIL